jgi:UDP-N-acetylmuramoylalanine--D-glutamate ligase
MVNSFSKQRVVILGLARQGVAQARFFASQRAHVIVSDAAPAENLQDALRDLEESGLTSGTAPAVQLVLGGHPISLLDGCDILCLSGGVPPQIPIVQEAQRRGIPLTNDAILTIEHSPAPVVGITGASGKTTTTTLVGLMLTAAGYTVPQHDGGETISPKDHDCVWVGGNIGTPLVDKLECIKPADWVVLELSSFQLELLNTDAGGRSLSPTIANVLNITPNHLDRHPSMAHYTACKSNILRWQKTSDTAVLGADNPITAAWLRSGQVRIEAGAGQPSLEITLAARRLGFGDLISEQCNASSHPVEEGCWLHKGVVVLRLAGREEPILPAASIQLRGRHNLLNVMAACATAGAVGVPASAMAEVARTFTGVPHRLEVVRDVHQVRWINDSIATTPERAVAALRAFDEPIILLAGGRDKKLPWAEFAVLVHQRVKHLIVFGEAADLIADAVGQHLRSGTPADAAPLIPLTRCIDLAEAVTAASRIASPGDVVLLSPGGTSFDAYKDFEARGRHFRALVEQLR